MSYTVRLDLFEGPLDLLLYLIRKEEIEITEISVARITEQYLSYMETIQALELDSAGEYILVAATLVRMKSRMLLPRKIEEEEEDPQADLILQLKEYRKFKEVAGHFSGLAKERSQLHDFQPVQPLDELRSHEEKFDLDFVELMGALRGVMGLVAEREARHHVELENVTIEEKVEVLRVRLRGADRFLFRDIFSEATEHVHVVVTFMALLEMMKLGEVRIYQEGNFAEIWIESSPHFEVAEDVPAEAVQAASA